MTKILKYSDRIYTSFYSQLTNGPIKLVFVTGKPFWHRFMKFIILLDPFLSLKEKWSCEYDPRHEKWLYRCSRRARKHESIIIIGMAPRHSALWHLTFSIMTLSIMLNKTRHSAQWQIKCDIQHNDNQYKADHSCHLCWASVMLSDI